MRAREAKNAPFARSRRGEERGASLVEFAIIMPLLLLLIFSVFEFGRLVATHIALNTAAREGARFGTTIGDRNLDDVPNFADCAEIREVAKQRAVMANLEDGDIRIFFDQGEGTAVYADCQGGPAPTDDVVATGDRIRVVVSRPFSSTIPLIGGLLNGIEFEAEQSRTIFRTIVDE
ncbi:MAG TPA: TadE family protein [Acidimicrobiia bacterium]|nr:TadE family protein [Acidimicrobiia bacterium]